MSESKGRIAWHSSISSGQIHFVVGAASGIGQAAALRLAGLGANVVCIDQDEAGLEATRTKLEKSGYATHTATADITDGGVVKDTFSRLLGSFGPIDGLVNCAGITGHTGMKSHEVDPEDFDRVYAVNLRGALAVSQAVLPAMLERGYGRILHVASISGKDGNAGMAAYSATKAGLIGLVKVMGKEYAQAGITVNALAPAVVRTPILDGLPQTQIDYMTSKIPMGRTGTLTEVSDMIAWIVSRECSFVTGFTFDLTGGRAVY
jgi:2-dehydro-3-deoxy-L-rhamnonate dehydrogenase (NAD+)